MRTRSDVAACAYLCLRIAASTPLRPRRPAQPHHRHLTGVHCSLADVYGSIHRSPSVLARQLVGLTSGFSTRQALFYLQSGTGTDVAQTCNFSTILASFASPIHAGSVCRRVRRCVPLSGAFADRLTHSGDTWQSGLPILRQTASCPHPRIHPKRSAQSSSPSAPAWELLTAARCCSC